MSTGENPFLNISLTAENSFINECAEVLAMINRILLIVEKDTKEVIENLIFFGDTSNPLFYNQLYTVEIATILTDAIQTEQFSRLTIQDWDTVQKGKKDKRANISIRIVFDPKENPGDYRYNISMWFNEGISRLLIDSDIKSMIEELAMLIRADYGCISYQRSSLAFPIYTDEMKISNLKLLPQAYNLYGIVPGCFWWTLLSQTHIAKLGGRKNVIEHAPCYAVRDLSDDAYSALGLQLTQNIQADLDMEKQELREFLRPVLPPINVYSLAFEMKQGHLANLHHYIPTAEMETAKMLTEKSFPELRAKARRE